MEPCEKPAKTTCAVVTWLGCGLQRYRVIREIACQRQWDTLFFSLEKFNAVYVSGKGSLRAGLSLYTHQEMSVNLELLAPQSVPICSAEFQDAALRPYSYLSAGELEPMAWPLADPVAGLLPVPQAVGPVVFIQPHPPATGRIKFEQISYVAMLLLIAHWMHLNLII